MSETPSRPRKEAGRAASRAAYELTWPGKAQRPPARGRRSLLHLEAHDGPAAPSSLFDARLDDFRNQLVWGDNLPVMEALLSEFRGKVDLVYLDPPFDAGHDFTAELPLGNNGKGTTVSTRAFRDTWGVGPDSYLQMLYERLPLVRELLCETGSLIVHVNWRVAHLVQALLDEVFGLGERAGTGQAGFRNEIIWGYGGGGAVKDAYRRKHDNLYWYTRSDHWTFHPQFRPYTDKTRQRGLTAVKGDRYELREEGAALETWWTGPEVQKILSPTAYENLKYPTQKPETLLERILLGHSNQGDLVADLFCGSGTTGAVAERLGRRWLMADQSPLAIHTSRKRLLDSQQDRAASAEPYRGFDLLCEGVPELGEGEIQVEPLFHEDGTADLRLVDFRPQLDPRAPAILRECAEAAPLDLVDYWAVDFSGGGRARAGTVFRPQWQSYRTPRQRRLELTSAVRHRYHGPGPFQATVQVIDVLGNATLTTIAVDPRLVSDQ